MIFPILPCGCTKLLRLDVSNTTGVKVLMPIRPVMALSGNLDLGEASIRLI